jgi:Flp pilus assembly protein CpaB
MRSSDACACSAVNIVQGEQILTSRFVERGSTNAGLVIPKGKQAMSLEVEAPPGVAGFVHVGSRISVLGHVDVPGTNGSAVEPQTQFLVQGVEVLAVGSRAVQAATDGARAEAANQQQVSDKVLLTLAVTPNEAEKLGFAILEGQIYITLLPEDAEPVKTSGRNRRNEFR